MTTLLLIAVLVLALVNGANDVSRGVATLVGSRRARPPIALGWGALWTALGGYSGYWLARSLLDVYLKIGSTRTADISSEDRVAIYLVTAVAAAGWVACATWRKLPVSTTHALTGGLLGAAIAAGMLTYADGWAAGLRLLLPLLVSPLLAFGIIILLQPAWRRAHSRFTSYCVCLEHRAAASPASAQAMAMRSECTLTAGPAAECPPSPLVIARMNTSDLLHWTSAALISFARGLNDLPKILALGWAAGVWGASLHTAFALGAFVMGMGGLIGGHLVTHTMGFHITRMNAPDGLLASNCTAGLVGLASVFGFPVSTTHVASGAIMGLSRHSKGGFVRRATVGHILLAWLITLPCTLLMGFLVYRIVS